MLIQADLTAVAPGPLLPHIARELGLLADVESAGAATVYRFSEASLRRAFDAGRTAVELHQLIERLARGTVPQGLTYLIDDIARRHGRLRAGSAGGYLRSEDPALLAEVVANRRTASAGLVLVAPTVAVSPLEPAADPGGAAPGRLRAGGRRERSAAAGIMLDGVGAVAGCRSPPSRTSSAGWSAGASLPGQPRHPDDRDAAPGGRAAPARTRARQRRSRDGEPDRRDPGSDLQPAARGGRGFGGGVDLLRQRRRPPEPADGLSRRWSAAAS